MNLDIAIVGAGFSGSMLALQILRMPGRARVYLIERATTFGRGLAYGAADPEHLLNVRAANMSAFADDPDHFARWLQQVTGSGTAPAFASRQLFGTYLQQQLGDVVRTAQAAGRLITVGDEVVGLQLDGRRPRLRTALGREIEADRVILATGNLPPYDLACLADLDPASYISDPWAPNAFVHLLPSDDVLLVGTGLTAVDMMMRLQSRAHRGSINAISRRGLRPRRHAEAASAAAVLPVPTQPSVTALLRLFRQEARRRSWHDVVDGLRPSVQRLWREAMPSERQRFLRHLRPWWDVHRHRVAPAVADIIDELEHQGRLTVLAGRIQTVQPRTDGIDVLVRSRGESKTYALRVQRIVNCTGPAGDVAKVRAPLIGDLLARGLARPDASGLGLDVDTDCRLIDAAGNPQTRLFAVGPMSRGAFWEVVAVPDIRVQAARLAADLSPEQTRDCRADKVGFLNSRVAQE